jgi:hypothetical protein
MTVDFFLLFFRGSERFFFIIESKRSLWRSGQEIGRFRKWYIWVAFWLNK